MVEFLLKYFRKRKNNIEPIVGSMYSGLGNCGMTKDVEVIGKLIEFNHPHDHAILVENQTGRHCSVILKTLKKI